jgi:dynein heavy chain 2
VAKRSLLSQPINLADLFSPGTFLNALRQQTSRRTGASMDQLTLVCAWEASRLKNAPLVVTLEGLLLQVGGWVACLEALSTFQPLRVTMTSAHTPVIQGAIVSGSSLAEPQANAAEVVSVPSLYVAFIGTKDSEPYEDRQTVALPLYLTMSREKFVVELTVPTDKPPSKWILAGTALFLTGDE